LKCWVALDVYNCTERLRPIMEERADISPLPTRTATVHRLGIVAEGGQLDQLIELVPDNCGSRRKGGKEVRASWIVCMRDQILDPYRA
jgi:hypothetical protein